MFAVWALVILTSGAPQQAAAAPARMAQLPKPVRAISSAVRPAEASLVGTIERFESPARRLVLRTHEGRHVSFIVPAGATIRLGPKTLPATELSTHSGRRAKIRFTEADGKRTAHWVVISTDAPKTPQ